jgi:predicted phage terminase large subunit-like protein
LTVWDAVAAGIFSPEEADDARETLPDAVFRELYLAEAVDAEEAFFDTSQIAIVTGFPDHVRTARAWDFAVSAHKSGSNPDYTVGAKLAHADRHTYVVDVIRRRAAPHKIAQLVQTTAAADGRACDQIFEEEHGAAGKMMVAQFKTTLTGVEGAGRVYPASVTGGKEVRAFHFASACNDRRVSVVEADWNHDFFGELDDFRDGDKDDQVDAAAHAFNHLAPNLKPRVRWL